MAKTFVLLILLGLFPVVANASDLKLLQGTWVGTESGFEDKGKVTMTVTKDQVEFQGWRQGEWYKGTIELSKSDDRKKAFATITECPIPEFVGKICNGIYECDNDTFTIASRAPGDPNEPTGFDDDKCRKMTFKKQK